MNLNKDISEIIKATALEYISFSEILLFGSRARNDSTFESDYDILIIIDHYLSPAEKLPVKTRIRKDLLKSGIRSDILIQSKTEVEAKKKLPGHIIRSILKEAVFL